MKKVLLALSCVMIFGLSLISAQTRTITGTVTGSDDGLPVPGASIMVKGTSLGTAVLPDGSYRLNVPADASVLVVTFIGMRTEEIGIAGRSVIDVILQNDAFVMDELIVVAYGTVKREARTGSVTAVTGDKIAETPVSSIDKALAGKLAGVSITSASGQPGASSDIRIRGTSSINAGNNPLWVVDGIPIMDGDQSVFTNTGNAIAALNTNDIESITVLKDAAAASVYGSRAANGVILVTTKSGKDGQSRFTARVKQGASWLANDNNYGIMTAEELLGFQRQAIRNAGINPDDPSSGYYRPMELLSRPLTNWMDHLTRLGNLQEYEISAAGGNARGNYFSSVSYHKNEGIYYGIDFQKITARFNSDYKLTNTLETGSRINVAYTEGNDIPMQSLYYSNPAFAGMTILPWTPTYDSEGKHNANIPENSNSNPRATAEYDEQFSKQYRFSGNMYLQWSPLKTLVFRTTNAIETTFESGRRYWSPENNQGEATLQTSRAEYIQMTTSNTATFSDIFADIHSVRVLVGQEAMQRNYDYFYAYSPKVNPAIPYPTTSTSDIDYASYSKNTRTMLSYFGILDYNMAAKYYLQASLRYDGSSLFGSENKWGLFWSVGASWNIHNEDFLKSLTYINMLKLRASYGVNGNNNILPYRAYEVYASTEYNGASGLRPSRPENPLLSWEMNYTWNIGLDFRVLDWLSGSVDVYNRRTKDMLLDKDVPQTTGFSTNFMNIGELSNKGVEIQLDADLLRDILSPNGMTWNVGANIAFNKTKIINLGDNEELTYILPNLDSDSRLKHKVGESFLTFYLKDYYGVNPTNGEPLYRTEDGTITNDYNKAAWIYPASPEPKFTGGFNTSFSWKGLNLGAFFEYKGGNHVMIIENRYFQADGNQMNMNQAKPALNYWKQPGDTGVNPKPIAGNTNNGYNFNTTRILERGDYMRIKDITLSYTLPKKITDKAMLGSAKFYMSALNIYTFHDVDFWDPERGVNGMGYGVYPMTKSFIGGIEITF